MTMPIIGVILAKNEDAFIKYVIEGIQNFVSDIIMIDNCSTDCTVEIAKRCGVQPITEPDLKRTHSYVERFAGKGVWIFGVDGDEIFDANGLEKLYSQMEAGMYDLAYQIQGWYLHATEFRPGESTAMGYLGPPAHTPTKLYNMSMISRWPNTHDDVLFHVGTKVQKGLKMRVLPDTWEGNPLRCIHTRFLRRSFAEPDETIGVRFGPGHVAGKRLRSSFKGKEADKNYRWNYRRGEIREVSIWPLEEDRRYAV